jgi:hypothetical protein
MLKKRNPKNLKVKVVKRFSDSRTKAEIIGRTIKITPHTTKAEIAHEEGHYVLGHNTYKNPKTPESFAKQEIDANVYAHSKTNAPKHIKAKLRGVFNDITKYEYHASPHKATVSLDKAIKRKVISAEWKKDWQEIKREARQVFGKL